MNAARPFADRNVAAMLKSPPLITVTSPISHCHIDLVVRACTGMATQAVSAEGASALFRIGRMVADSRRNRTFELAAHACPIEAI